MAKIEKTGISKLDLINKMVILRQGDIPIQLIILLGPKEDADSALEKEKGILNEYFEEAEPGNEAIHPGKVSFAGEHDYKERNIPLPSIRHEKIDVTGFSGSGWKAFVGELKLDGLTDEMLLPLGEQCLETLKGDFSGFVAKVLYAHYEEFDDNSFRQEDFDAIKRILGAGEVTETEEKRIDRKESEKEPEPDDDKGTTLEELMDMMSCRDEIRGESIDSGSGSVGPEKPIDGKAAAPHPQDKSRPERKMRKLGTICKKGEMNAAGADSHKPEQKGIIDSKEAPLEEDMENEDGEAIPKPTQSERKEHKYLVKEELSDAESAENDRLLREIRNLYDSTIRFTEETCNSRYRVIINKMRESVKDNSYKSQFCPMYLEISDDTSSDLYRKLYDLDKATQAFQKKVVHQIRRIGCPFCGNEWLEDITFFEKGPHFVSCPKCYAEQGFEKL